ncbi:MAG: preprotein translocase subunit SecE [Desulfuromonas sp.]|nr:MAG: preprotein translocase subunit SecE [Desulfuromonas sp.]
MIGKVSEFLSNVKSELNKTTWPTKKDTYGSTVVVIVLVIAVAIFLWLVDSGLSRLIKYLLS